MHHRIVLAMTQKPAFETRDRNTTLTSRYGIAKCPQLGLPRVSRRLHNTRLHTHANEGPFSALRRPPVPRAREHNCLITSCTEAAFGEATTRKSTTPYPHPPSPTLCWHSTSAVGLGTRADLTHFYLSLLRALRRSTPFPQQGRR